MTLARYVDALPAGGPPARDRSSRRARVVPQLRAHAARVHVRTRRLRFVRRTALTLAAVSSAAAAIILVAPGARVAPSRTATVAVLDGTLWLEDGVARRTLRTGEASGLGAGALEAPADEATRVQLANTATLTLAPASRVGTVVAANTEVAGAPAIEAVNLLRGRAHLKVTKLHAGQRFHVLTPDADVQVRGTEFDVELHPGSVPATCVRVQEGLVAVFASGETHMVAPGQTWGCEAPVAAAPAPVEAAHVRKIAVAPRVIERPVDRPSDLRAQNALFQQALEAQRAGRGAAAARLYQQLLARAPRGPLSEQARANLGAVRAGIEGEVGGTPVHPR
ncbi:MAG TPA: FecR family protein [Polyangia bacterium]|nr:FecR family protein [Polyangia bacterium]